MTTGKRVKKSLAIIAGIIFAMGFSTASTFSQSNEDKPKEKETPKEIEIPVKKDAGQNGYKLILEDNKSSFQIVNIVKPKTLEVANGKVKMNYLCEKHKKTKDETDKDNKDDPRSRFMDIYLSNGLSPVIPSPCVDKLQPFMQINFIIALQGTFPSRN